MESYPETTARSNTDPLPAITAWWTSAATQVNSLCDSSAPFIVARTREGASPYAVELCERVCEAFSRLCEIRAYLDEANPEAVDPEDPQPLHAGEDDEATGDDPKTAGLYRSMVASVRAWATVAHPEEDRLSVLAEDSTGTGTYIASFHTAPRRNQYCIGDAAAEPAPGDPVSRYAAWFGSVLGYLRMLSLQIQDVRIEANRPGSPLADVIDLDDLGEVARDLHDIDLRFMVIAPEPTEAQLPDPILVTAEGRS
ncbi:MAG: hypothetical protein JWO38_7681 [Gemmataceae bacterium]|nr:hypothetical protein [Gemmataceae bacterium]